MITAIIVQLPRYCYGHYGCTKTHQHTHGNICLVVEWNGLMAAYVGSAICYDSCFWVAFNQPAGSCSIADLSRPLSGPNQV